MVRLLAFWLIAATLTSCGPARTVQASLPAGCGMGTAVDLRQIRIYADERDVFEAVDPKRAAITQEPTADSGYPPGNATRPQFRLSQDGDLGHRNCLAFGWKVVPVGRAPVTGADFEGNTLPSGIAVVPKEGPGSYETNLPIRAVDDHATEPNEQFRIELTDASGSTIWGAAEPDKDRNGFLVKINPKAAIYTIHDTERDCARPGEGSGYSVSVRQLGGTYRLAFEGPENPVQCAYIAWRYLDDTLPPDPDSDVPNFLQGAAYFPSDPDSNGLGGDTQWFDLGIPATAANAGRHVRIVWGLGTARPAIAALTLPPPLRPGDAEGL